MVNKMMTDRMTYRWLWSCLIAGGLLLVGCTDRSEDEIPHQSYTPPEQGTPLKLGAVTRTDGATKYNGSQSIQVYLSTGDENVTTGTFTGTTTSGSNLNVKEETKYYMYGYMPSSISATQSAHDGDYSKGINLTLSNLPAITIDDIGIIVGVQRVGSTSTTELPNVTEGQYGFRSGIKGENFVNLLMAHLYARLSLSFKIDPEYAELRSIHLKEVTLTSKYGNSGPVTVNLRNGQGIGSPAFPSASEDQAEQSVTLLNRSDTEKVLDKSLGNTAMSLDIPVYCRPIAVVQGKTYNLTLTTKYEVWDRAYDKTQNKVVDKNNLGERKSVNKVQFNIATVSPGLDKPLVLTVKPTYLYILSDNDLNNPIVTIN